jgi:hypothetical protein
MELNLSAISHFIKLSVSRKCILNNIIHSRRYLGIIEIFYLSSFNFKPEFLFLDVIVVDQKQLKLRIVVLTP